MVAAGSCHSEIPGLLLEFPEERLKIRRAAYDYSRPMVMKEMGRRYLALFSQAKVQHARARDLPALDTLSQREQRLPQINLNHLCGMTDDTGMLQHAKFTAAREVHGSQQSAWILCGRQCSSPNSRDQGGRPESK